VAVTKCGLESKVDRGAALYEKWSATTVNPKSVIDKADPQNPFIKGGYRQILLKNSLIWMRDFSDENQTTLNFINK